MDQTFPFIPSPSRMSPMSALRRVAWIDDAQVVARVLPEPKLIGPAHVCARLADLRRLARRYRDLKRGNAEFGVGWGGSGAGSGAGSGGGSGAGSGAGGGLVGGGAAAGGSAAGGGDAGGDSGALQSPFSSSLPLAG